MNHEILHFSNRLISANLHEFTFGNINTKLVVSSRNMLVEHVSITAGRSFKNKRKSNRPRIDPCGTPTVTCKGLDRCPLTITDCDHPVR